MFSNVFLKLVDGRCLLDILKCAESGVDHTRTAQTGGRVFGDHLKRLKNEVSENPLQAANYTSTIGTAKT
jgi:hypothetical protein